MRAGPSRKKLTVHRFTFKAHQNAGSSLDRFKQAFLEVEVPGEREPLESDTRNFEVDERTGERFINFAFTTGMHCAL